MYTNTQISWWLQLNQAIDFNNELLNNSICLELEWNHMKDTVTNVLTHHLCLQEE